MYDKKKWRWIWEKDKKDRVEVTGKKLRYKMDGKDEIHKKDEKANRDIEMLYGR
jgi:hypothetical protein